MAERPMVSWRQNERRAPTLSLSYEMDDNCHETIKNLFSLNHVTYKMGLLILNVVQHAILEKVISLVMLLKYF